MIEQALYEHLKANVPLVTGRVFANVMHQNTDKPAMVYTVVSERDITSLGGDCNDVNIEWQVHVYAEEYLENKLVKNEVKAALKTFEPWVRDIVVSDGFDEQSELYVQVITFHTGKRK